MKQIEYPDRQAVYEGKLAFAKQGIFNVRTVDDLETYVSKLPYHDAKLEDHWHIWQANTDKHNEWNALWTTVEYEMRSDSTVKTLKLIDGNLTYKPHCIQRIFERNGFDPKNLPKSIDLDDPWLSYGQTGVSDDFSVEHKKAIPFMDGLLIVTSRLGIIGTIIECYPPPTHPHHQTGVKNFSEPFGKRSYTAYTYLEDLNEKQNQTLFYIQNGQYDKAESSSQEWIKHIDLDISPDERNVLIVESQNKSGSPC